MKRWITLVLTALCALTVRAYAAVPQTMSYQGVLTDATGQLVPDGNYDLTFRLYSVPSAGTERWAEFRAATPVTRGVFNLLLGALNPLDSLAFDVPLYLGVQVGTDPEMNPRVALASSPYSLGLYLPFVGSATSATPLIDLTNLGTGSALRANGTIEAGSSTVNGALQKYSSGHATPTVSITDNFLLPGVSGGGSVRTYDTSGNLMTKLENSPGNGGGLATIMRNTTQAGIVLSGADAFGDPTLSILGASRSCVFSMTNTDNNSVQLPNNAISAPEIRDEPGVAAANKNTATQLTGGVQAILTRTITVPVGATGYVIAMGSVSIETGHTNGSFSRTIAGVSDAAASFPVTQTYLFGISSAAPTGNYEGTIASTGVFPVSAGANTFYLLAQEVSGGSTADDAQLTLLFVPTNYGTTTGTIVAGDDATARPVPAAALTGADIAAEQREATDFNRTRLQRELDEARVQLESVQRQLSATAAPAKK